MGRKKTAVPALLLAAALLGSGCGGPDPRGDHALKLGLLGSMQSIREETPELIWGLELAAEDLNRKYRQDGYTVTLEYFDDKGEKGGAAKAASEITEREDIDFILVLSRDPALEKAAKRLKKSNRITFWLDEAGQAARQENSDFQFYNTYRLEDQAAAIAAELKNRDIRSLGVVCGEGTASQATGRALEAAAEEAGISVTRAEAEEEEPEAAAEVLGEVQAAAAVTGDAETNLALIRALRRQDPQRPVAADHTVDRTKILREGAEALEGVILPCDVKTQWESAELNSVLDRYQSVYHETSQAGWVTHGYFTAAALADAAVHCHTADPEILSAYLKSSASPRYQFDSQGMLRAEEIPLLRAESGVFALQ